MRYSNFLRPHILMGSNLILFFRIIAKLNFSIKGSVIGRLTISFFILLLFTPFRFIEAVLSLFAKKEEVKQPVFIVGHFRSGTTFFHDSLNELDAFVAPRMIDCLYPYLNRYIQFILIPILKRVLPEERLMDKMKVAWDSPQEEEFALSLMTMDTSVSFLFAPKTYSKDLNKSVLLGDSRVKEKWLKAHMKFARKFQSMNKGKTLVFKSPSNTSRIKELLEIYPDAKFIHLVRNPMDVIPSTLNLYKKILPEFSLQDEKQIDFEEFVFNVYDQVMRQFMERKNEIDTTQLVELKYEDFVNTPIQLISEAFEQLNIATSVNGLESFFESRKNFTRNDFIIDEKLKKSIQIRCSSVIEEYSYS